MMILGKDTVSYDRAISRANFRCFGVVSDSDLVSEFKIAIDSKEVEQSTIGMVQQGSFFLGTGISVEFDLIDDPKTVSTLVIGSGDVFIDAIVPDYQQFDYWDFGSDRRNPSIAAKVGLVRRTKAPFFEMKSLLEEPAAVHEPAKLEMGKYSEHLRLAYPLTKEVVSNLTFSLKLYGEVKRLQNDGKIDSALDVLYSKIDHKLLEGNFGAVDFSMQHLNIESIRNELLLGLLTITLPYKKYLVARDLFYDKVEKRLAFAYNGDHNRVKRTLQGLS